MTRKFRRASLLAVVLGCVPLLLGPTRTAATVYYLYDAAGNRIAAFDSSIMAPSAASAPGVVFMFAGSSCPSGSLPADGSAVPRLLYVALYTAIQTTYGAGDGYSTFNLPDLRAEFVRGLDNMGGPAGPRGVDASLTLGSRQSDGVGNTQVPIKTSNYVNATAAVYTSSKSALAGGMASGVADSWENWGPIGTVTARTNAINMGTPETRPRNVALLYCIQY